MNATAEPTVVFDLDGTLVQTEAFEGKLFAEAIRDVVGDIEIDTSWQGYRHVTDVGIVSQILEEQGLSKVDGLTATIRAAFGEKVRKHIDNGGSCPATPGAKAAIQQLRESGHRIGIATGGWGHTARMKLQRAGIPTDGLVLATSDDSFDRVQIMRSCLRQLGGKPDRAIYVGDGIWDLDASRRAGWGFVGVGRKLQGRCETWIADFLDPAWYLADLRRFAAPGR